MISIHSVAKIILSYWCATQLTPHSARQDLPRTSVLENSIRPASNLTTFQPQNNYKLQRTPHQLRQLLVLYYCSNLCVHCHQISTLSSPTCRPKRLALTVTRSGLRAQKSPCTPQEQQSVRFQRWTLHRNLKNHHHLPNLRGDQLRSFKILMFHL